MEVRELLAGTQYRLEERPREIPDGYSFQKYDNYGAAEPEDRGGVSGVAGKVAAGVDPHVDVCNIKGWGLRLNKVWSDAGFMASRETA